MFKNYQELFQSYYEFYRDGTSGLNSTYTGFMIDERRKKVPTILELVHKKTVKESSIMNIGFFDGFNFEDLTGIFAVFICLIIAKRELSYSVKNSSFLNKLGLRLKDRIRLDECIWRLLFYTFSSTWLIYTCFFKRHSQIYFNPKIIFAEYSFTIDLDEYLICMIEIGFYLHAIYAIIYEDIWRRDSPAVIIHHLAAIFTMAGLYSTRTHKIGLIAVVLRDTCDVVLELGKLNMSLKVQHGKVVKSLDKSLKVCMVVFTSCFIMNQLYYYPLFCLYHALNMTKLHNFQNPVITGIHTCALLFLLLDLFWFTMILRLLIRMIFFNKPMTDLREYDEEEDSFNIASENNKENSLKRKARYKID